MAMNQLYDSELLDYVQSSFGGSLIIRDLDGDFQSFIRICGSWI